MKHRTLRRTIVMYSKALFLVAAICLATPLVLAQTPADGQTPGAAISEATPGTTPIPNTADQLGNMGGVKAGQQASIDKMFVKAAMQGGLAEIELGQLTLEKSSNDKVKQFAKKMVDDHTEMNEKLRPVALQLGVDIPTEPSKKDKGRIKKMQDLSGQAYDDAYIKDMVKDHKQDVSVFHTIASNGHTASVKDVATSGGQTVAEHLQMAQQLAKEQNIDLAKK